LLVREKCPSVLCIQETKLMVCDELVCSSLWGDSSHDYSYRPSVGASGWLLTVWDTSEVEVWSTWSQDHMLQTHGRFLRTNEEFYLINIYALCDFRAKEELWKALSVRLQSLRGRKVCVCGDFNVVRRSKE
jgi:exonuclease III